MTVASFIRLECAECDGCLLYPADKAATDRLRDAAAAHLLVAHPELPAAAAERTIERSLDAAEPVDVADDAVEPRRWIR